VRGLTNKVYSYVFLGHYYKFLFEVGHVHDLLVFKGKLDEYLLTETSCQVRPQHLVPVGLYHNTGFLIDSEQLLVLLEQLWQGFELA